MDQDLQEVRSELKRLSKITEDNNIMLRKLYRQARFYSFMSILKWIIIIGVTIGAFYYFQPFFQEITSIYQKVTGSNIDFFNLLKSIHY